MRRKAFLACILVSSFTCLLALSPTSVLNIRAEETGARVFCSAVSVGDEIVYRSINSIYQAPVDEYWRVQEDNSLAAIKVISAPAVMEYYGIADYVRENESLYRGVPREVRYHEIRMKVGPRGKQRLVVRGREISLYEMAPEATTLIINVEDQPRIIACL